MLQFGGGYRIFFYNLQVSRIKVDRWLNEKEEYKHEDPHKEYQKLHRHLDDTVEEQTQSALRQGSPAQVALHLRLVGTEIRKEKKNAS